MTTQNWPKSHHAPAIRPFLFFSTHEACRFAKSRTKITPKFFRKTSFFMSNDIFCGCFYTTKYVIGHEKMMFFSIILVEFCAIFYKPTGAKCDFGRFCTVIDAAGVKFPLGPPWWRIPCPSRFSRGWMDFRLQNEVAKSAAIWANANHHVHYFVGLCFWPGGLLPFFLLRLEIRVALSPPPQ